MTVLNQHNVKEINGLKDKVTGLTGLEKIIKELDARVLDSFAKDREAMIELRAALQQLIVAFLELRKGNDAKEVRLVDLEGQLKYQTELAKELGAEAAELRVRNHALRQRLTTEADKIREVVDAFNSVMPGSPNYMATARAAHADNRNTGHAPAQRPASVETARGAERSAAVASTSDAEEGEITGSSGTSSRPRHLAVHTTMLDDCERRGTPGRSQTVESMRADGEGPRRKRRAQWVCEAPAAKDMGRQT